MLKQIWRVIDRGFGVVIWLNDRVMLFICVVWLMPMLFAAAVSLTIADIRPWYRQSMLADFWTALAVVPLWLGFCLFAEFSRKPWAAKFRQLVGWAPIVLGGALLVLGGLLALVRMGWR